MLRRAVYLPSSRTLALGIPSAKSSKSFLPSIQLLGGFQSQGWLMIVGSAPQHHQLRSSASWTSSSNNTTWHSATIGNSAIRFNHLSSKNGIVISRPINVTNNMLVTLLPLGSRSLVGGRTPPRVPNNNSSNNQKNRWWQNGSTLGAIGTGAIVLFGKTKYLLVALKFTKLATLGSMLISIGTYSMFFGLPYAAGVVGLIAVHEGGHALVMNRFGIPFSPALFIPFVGAVIAMQARPRDAWEDALVAFGGPVVGSLGAVGVAVVGHATQSQLCLALADFGFMVNLFNLLPIGAMDGGRIADSLSPYAGVAGLGMGGLLFYEGYISNPIIVLILLAGGWHSFNRFYYPEAMPPNYYKITTAQRMQLTGGYFGLIAALVAATAANNHYRKPPEVLEQERQREVVWDMR